MRRIVVCLALFASALAPLHPTDGAVARIGIFSDDFESPDAGCCSSFPPFGWITYNVDDRTPHPDVAFMHRFGWIVRDDFDADPGDQVAYGNSWYDPVGAADDWMWTPPFWLQPSAVLSWDAVSKDPSFREAYEVRLFLGNDIPGWHPSESVVIATIGAENETWTSRAVDIGALGHTTGPARIGFRNVSNDKYLLGIDDVRVEADRQEIGVTVGGKRVVTTRGRKAAAEVTFTADRPVQAFECWVDAEAPAPCTSPWKTPKLRAGKHTISVRATDAIGQTGTAERVVRIKRV